MLRKCSSCKIEKDINEFHFKYKKTEKRHYDCKICQKEKAHDHYLKNKTIYKKHSILSKQNTKKWWNDFKSTLKCEQCGENHPGCLDFHHIEPNEKKFGVSVLIGRNNKNEALKEIKKCIVICSNCHRKLHWKEK